MYRIHFHDVVLGICTSPLPMCDRNVLSHIDSRKHRARNKIMWRGKINIQADYFPLNSSLFFPFPRLTFPYIRGNFTLLFAVFILYSLFAFTLVKLHETGFTVLDGTCLIRSLSVIFKHVISFSLLILLLVILVIHQLYSICLFLFSVYSETMKTIRIITRV